MKILQAPYIIPLLMYVPMAIIIICKYIFPTQASLLFLGNPYRFITELLIQASDVCFIACIHFWLHRFIEKRLHMSPIILNLYVILVYLDLTVVSLYDFENTRYNMQSIVYSTIKAYVPALGFKNIFSRPLDMLDSEVGNDVGAFESIAPTIIDAPKFWIFIVSFFLLFFIFCIMLIVKYRNILFFAIHPSLYSMFLEKTEDDDQKLSCDCVSLINRNYDVIIPENEFNNPYFKTIHLFGLFYLIFAFSYLNTSMRQKISNISSFPITFNLLVSLSHFEKKLNKNIDLLGITRRFLPKGRYWIDNRQNPIYPMVHGDIDAFCSYNPNDEKCQSRKPSRPKVVEKKSPPNVAFLIYESMNPFTYLINDEFIDEHSLLSSANPKFYVTDTPYYSTKTMPNLAKYAKEGITFSGMASHGLPTFSGWHSLMTGVPPSQTYMNIVEGVHSHVDDLPSHFHDNDYRTFFVSAPPFDFDGMTNWVYRRSAEDEAMIQLKCINGSDNYDDPIQMKLMGSKNLHLRKCTEKEIRDKAKNLPSFPKWFDYLSTFFPDANQSELLGLSRPTLKKALWQADRIVAKQFMLHWRQQKALVQRRNIGKPLFGMSLNAEPHIPYMGYDQEEQYDHIPASVSRFGNEIKRRRFIRVNKYSDKHFIEEIIKFLKREDNNTIVVVVGDHGTRDVPLRSANSVITNKTRFSSDCFQTPSGVDSLFITSGTIFYLGDDPEVKKALRLDDLKGKTVKVATDHNDITYTIMDIIAKLKGESLPPTHKLGRNLIDYSESLISKLAEENGTEGAVRMMKEMDWQSISYLSHQIEYKRGAEFIRSHSANPRGAHYYEVAAFPTCIKRKGAKNMMLGGVNAKRMYNEMMDFLATQNYLLYNNRVYNYQFRDKECIKRGKCELPEQLKPIEINDVMLYGFVFGIPAGLTIIVSALFYLIRKKCSEKYQEDLLKQIKNEGMTRSLPSCGSAYQCGH